MRWILFTAVASFLFVAQTPDASVKAVLASPGFKAASAHLDTAHERLIQEIVQLTEIPAPPYHEAARGKAYLEMLRQAGLVRLYAKAAQIQARARQAGWEQALWEGLFRALGYKHNVWPMHRIAELRSRWCIPGAEPLAVQARLLGISGLLPTELTRSELGSDHYVRRVWDQWWRERGAFGRVAGQ